MIAQLTALFPLWALLFSALAYLMPEPFVPLKPAIAWLLGLIMLGMGLTLRPENFLEVVRRPSVIGIGVTLQYLLMPLLALGIALVLELPPALLAGMVLVGASPGGTASNVICYLARGDVALSITLTTASTLLAVLLTPALTLVYAGQSLEVPALAMLVDVLKIVVLPVLAGVFLNRLLHRQLSPLRKLFPLISVAAIVLIIAVIVALNRTRLAELAAVVVLAVALHNGLGLASGYGLARLFGRDSRTARTLAIEVGMQNSGLAVALAVKYFPAAAALPGAVFSIWHNLTGSLLASWWARRTR